MIINNIDLIRSLLVFPPRNIEGDTIDDIREAQVKNQQINLVTKAIDKRDCFYTIQLIQRQKDNPKQLFTNKNFRNNSNRTLEQFHIYSKEDFDLKIGTIIEIAKIYQARVYIELNLKDSKDVFAELFKNMSKRFETNNYSHLHRMYNEAVGETPTMAHSRKTWLVDIDTKDESFINEVHNYIESIKGGGTKLINTIIKGKSIDVTAGHVYATVPTKNGVHLITTSFDMELFKKKYPSLDVWKRNPTILWMETDWSEYNK